MIDRRNKYNKILNDIRSYYYDEINVLLDLLLKKGVKRGEIAKALGITDEALRLKINRIKKGGEDRDNA